MPSEVAMPIDEWIGNWRHRPDADLALRRYRAMADGYDDTCHRIEPLRALALQRLDPKPGETVFDVACGTGGTTAELARRVGPLGHVVGFELSERMAALASQRLASIGASHARISVGRIECAVTDRRADALFFSYTHDVLQQPEAIDALRRLARPGARYVVLGMCTIPWAWGFPVNAFVMWRARRYLTTFRGLSAPWARLQAVSQDFRIVGTWHAGTSYIAQGTLL